MIPPPMITTRACEGTLISVVPSRADEVRALAKRSRGTYFRRPRERGPSASLQATAASQPPAYGCLVHPAHLRDACPDRIAAGRRIDRSHLRKLVEMLALHAQIGQ